MQTKPLFLKNIGLRPEELPRCLLLESDGGYGIELIRLRDCLKSGVLRYEYY